MAQRAYPQIPQPHARICMSWAVLWTYTAEVASLLAEHNRPAIPLRQYQGNQQNPVKAHRPDSRAARAMHLAKPTQ